jgi:hypothetical protein
MSFCVTFLHLFWIVDSITLFKMPVKPIHGFIPASRRFRATLFDSLF